jgi:hypothetical protein
MLLSSHQSVFSELSVMADARELASFEMSVFLRGLPRTCPKLLSSLWNFVIGMSRISFVWPLKTGLIVLF